jgi:hypothetical protein
MDAMGEIEIKLEGSVGKEKLRPEHVDIDEIREILGQAAHLLFPTEKRAQRPLISYEIEEGSVRHKFRTLMQSVIGFGAVLSQIGSEGQIDFLHTRSAEAIESLQQLAVSKDYVVTLSANQQQLRIDKTTHYERSENLWAEAEFYLYGVLTNAGGKKNPNIHLDTEEFGSLTITTDKEYLAEEERNLLYKRFGIRAKGRQNLRTFEMDRNSLELIELFEYDTAYSESYLDKLLKKAAPAWEAVTDADAWLDDLRDNAHA